MKVCAVPPLSPPEKGQPSPRPTFWDGAVLLLVLLCALFSPLFRLTQPAGGQYAVTANGTTTVYSLSEDRRLTIQSNGITLLLVCEGGTVRVAESDCKNGVCVKTGAIKRRGESVVCLPAKVAVTIKTGKEGNYEKESQDAVVG